MGVPVDIDVTIDDGTGESEWFPLNRWGSALMRLTATIESGTPTYSVVGTQRQVLRPSITTTAADEITVVGFGGLSTDNDSTQDVVFKALKLKIDSGSGEVRLRVQTEGEGI